MMRAVLACLSKLMAVRLLDDVDRGRSRVQALPASTNIRSVR